MNGNNTRSVSLIPMNGAIAPLTPKLGGYATGSVLMPIFRRSANLSAIPPLTMSFSAITPRTDLSLDTTSGVQLHQDMSRSGAARICARERSKVPRRNPICLHRFVLFLDLLPRQGALVRDGNEPVSAQVETISAIKCELAIYTPNILQYAPRNIALAIYTFYRY